MLDDNGINSCIKNPDATKCPTGKYTTLTIYSNNNNNHNSENNNNNNNNNHNHTSKNNIDNFNNNAHGFFFQDYYNSSISTGSKPYTVTKRKANETVIYSNNKNSENNNDNNSLCDKNRCANSDDNNDNNMNGNRISAFTPTPSNNNADNAPPGRNNKNNVMRLPSFISHPNGIVLRDFKQKQRNYAAFGKKRSNLAANDDERRRIDDGALISSMALVEFLNESIQIPIDKEKFDMSAFSVTKKLSGIQLVTMKLVTLSEEMKMKMKMKTEIEMETDQRLAKALVEFLNESIPDIEMKKENHRLARCAKQRLPSFVSHPNGMILHVLKKSYIPVLSETKKYWDQDSTAIQMESY